MKATGIVRRIDDLGRIVIPKEIRRTMRIREGDSLEIYTNANGEVIFKKYSPVGELYNLAGQYAEVLNRMSGLPVLIADRDHFIAAAGLTEKDVLEKPISAQLEQLLEGRKNYLRENAAPPLQPADDVESIEVCCPITVGSDVVGCVALLSSDAATEMHTKLALAAASFLSSQLKN